MQNKILESLEWRYSTKKFDPAKRVSEGDLQTLLETLRLAPSSFGLQPWKFLVITNPELRESLFPYSWGNRQVTDASHLIVMCTPRDIGPKDVEEYLAVYEASAGSHGFNFRGYQDAINKFLAEKSLAERQTWMAEQVFIALGFLLSAAAEMRLDACPMGGFSQPDYDRVLKLEEKGLRSVVLCALGYRQPDDKYATVAKARFSAKRVFDFIS